MRVVISAGGTGGHIYPALAIINKIKEKEPKSEFLYIGTTDRMESTIIPKLGINYQGIFMKGFKKKLSLDNIKTIITFWNAIKKSKKLISEFDPDIVLGIGGYITAPVIYAAKKLGYKTFIHEQNSIPGKSNRFLIKYTDKVGVSLPSSIKYFDQKKTSFTGNPRSEEIIKVKAINKKDLGLSIIKKLVVIVMGSLGSETISEELIKIVPKFKDKNYEVLVVTGKDYYNKFKKILVPKNVKIVPYLNEMLRVLKVTDLIVSRAGASTIAEITAIGLPSILVPSPYVANNHQYYNAKDLEDEKAALILEEKDFNETNLLQKIDLILDDKDLYLAMKKNAKQLGISDSGDKIYQIISDLVKGK